MRSWMEAEEVCGDGMAQNGDAGLELAQIGKYANLKHGSKAGHVLLITRAHVPDLKLGVGRFVVQLARGRPAVCSGGRENCVEMYSQLDYALAAREQGSTEILEIWIKSSEPLSSCSWNVSTV
jgi:hypothetical protein